MNGKSLSLSLCDGLRRRALPGFAVWLLVLLPGVDAQAVLRVGERAPSFNLNNLKGVRHTLEENSGTALLVFIKLNDRNTTTALTQLNVLLRREPEISARIQRWIIVTRLSAGQKPPPWLLDLSDTWQILLDPRDNAYRAYRIIVTPTCVVVGPDQKIVAVHPGYDPGMAQRLRLALATALKLDLPPASRGEKPEQPEMNLQLARQLTARRLWDEAINFYDKAAALRPLPPVDRLALARIRLEIGQPEEALRLLDTLSTATALAGEVDQLRRQALVVKGGGSAPRAAPPVR